MGKLLCGTPFRWPPFGVWDFQEPDNLLCVPPSLHDRAGAFMARHVQPRQHRDDHRRLHPIVRAVETIAARQTKTGLEGRCGRDRGSSQRERDTRYAASLLAHLPLRWLSQVELGLFLDASRLRLLVHAADIEGLGDANQPWPLAESGSGGACDCMGGRRCVYGVVQEHQAIHTGIRSLHAHEAVDGGVCGLQRLSQRVCLHLRVPVAAP
mmetsp:Transcript_21819/g.53474  ORF Transcript_21819/g.53474 Transcript_21819/m.53474 type:complete len:210 (+) Transcript_21819:337-966(+)